MLQPRLSLEISVAAYGKPGRYLPEPALTLRQVTGMLPYGDSPRIIFSASDSRVIIVNVTLGQSSEFLPVAAPQSFSMEDAASCAVLVVGDSRFLPRAPKNLVRHGVFLLRASSSDQALAWLLDRRIPLGLAIIDATEPPAAYLDLAADLARLFPEFPILYVVGQRESVLRCSMEAECPESVLISPFTEEQLAARIEQLMLPRAARAACATAARLESAA